MPDSLPHPARVDVWFVDQANAFAQAQDDTGILTPQEQARAARFKIERPRCEWLATRWALRRILGEWLGMPPDAVCFEAGAHGKPFLPNRPDVFFNVSHTRGWSLVAVTESGPLGADIEWMAPSTAIERVARRFFAPVEVEAMMERPPQARRDAFFSLWTAKEAWLKAHGTGMTFSLQSFDASGILASPNAEIRPAGDGEVEPGWSAHAIKAPGNAQGDIRAALCLRTPAPTLVIHLYPAP